MYCLKCGAMLKQNIKYCTSCGVRLDDYASQPIESTIHEAKDSKTAIGNQNIMEHRNRKLIFGAFTFLVVIAGIIVAFISFNDPVKNTFKYIKTGNYDDAKNEYKKISDDRELINELDEELTVWADDFKQRIQMREVSYEQIKDIENCIKEFQTDKAKRTYRDLASLAYSLKISEECYKAATEYYEAGNYLNAITNFEQVRLEDSYYNDAREKRDSAIKQFKHSRIEEANEYADQGNYEEAKRVLEISIRDCMYLEHDEDISAKLAEYETSAIKKKVEYTKNEAEEKYVNGDYVEAINILRNSNLQDKDITDLYSEYYMELFQIINKEAEERFQQNGWSDSVEYLRDFYSIYENDETYLSLLDMYKSYAPVYLADVELFNESSKVLGRNTYYDRMGNKFDDGFISYPNLNFRNNDLEWYVAGEYSKLSGTIAFDTKDNMSTKLNYCGKIWIYCDDELVYKSAEIYPKTEPINFEINIQGVKYIKISNAGVCRVIINDLQVSK